jgi:GWxTD domain-containing protein
MAAVLLLATLVPAAAARYGEIGPSVNGERPRFVVNTPACLGADGRPQLRVQVVVPYPEILFVKQAVDRFVARIELVIIVYDAGGDQVGGDLWTREVPAATYPATVDPRNGFSHEERFAVPSGKLRVKVSVKDVESGSEGEIRRKVQVPAFDALPLSMSDLRFGSCAPASSADAFEPAYVRSRFGGEPLPPICIFGEIYDREREAGSGPERYRIVWRVEDDRRQERAADTLIVSADSARVGFVIRPALAPLTLGRYEFIAELDHRGWTLERRAPFEMDETRLSIHSGFDELVDMAGYIGTSSEISKLQRALPGEREALWDEFWQRRDPSPGTPENETKEEFFRRVQYANETFGTLNMSGWRSDRGMIYVRNGAPDQIESHPVNPSEPPYEIWHYFMLNRVYVFADRGGFGQYTLVSTRRGGG